MFICKKCAKEQGVDLFWFSVGPLSAGNCETCGQHAICYDYQGYKNDVLQGEPAPMPNAVDTICTELKKDKSPGSYYHTWQANIAMAIYDEFTEEEFGTRIDIHKDQLITVANQAAKRFLDNLISVSQSPTSKI